MLSRIGRLFQSKDIASGRVICCRCQDRSTDIVSSVGKYPLSHGCILGIGVARRLCQFRGTDVTLADVV